MVLYPTLFEHLKLQNGFATAFAKSLQISDFPDPDSPVKQMNKICSIEVLMYLFLITMLQYSKKTFD